MRWPLFTWGILDEDGNPARDPTFPPICRPWKRSTRCCNGEAPSGPDYEAYQAFNTAGFAAQKMVFLPEGTAPEIVEAWRQAFRDVFEDPGIPGCRRGRARGLWPGHRRGCGSAVPAWHADRPRSA